ncbi:hypothetical protein DFJ58DRAFT_766363 [Suillus subalutaceus]|uniref:uncharacterized protein n=1 Tax=Suillus subalutaceus TaxID=48586 RepID=UPI001B86C6BD|nr:uncharacterized protein DFJ58DRAFT_766363 [Suillus subalutaceus]KAG1869468.1 hypothetical protein DFJ58DRAFT_766363 [Suillus subalutaceus]
MFTTSTSTAQGWDRANGPFLGEVQYDTRIVAEGSGCAASKYQRVSCMLLLGVQI